MEQLAVQAVLDGKAQAHGPYIGMGSAATTSTYIAPANGSGLATQPSSVLRHNDSVMSGRATARSTTATATLRCFGGGPLHLTAAQATALLSQHATAARGAATAAAYACSLQHFTLMDPRAHSPGFMKNAPHGLLGWASSCTARAGYAVLDTVAPGWPHWVARRKVGQLLHAPVPRMTGLRWPWSAVQEVSASAANTHTKNTVRTDLVSILFGWHNPWNAATSAGSSRGLTGTSKSSSRSASVSASGCARGDQCRGHGHRTAHIMTAAAEDQLVRQAWDAHADAGMQPMQSRISADSSPGADSSQGTDSAASGGSAGKAGTSSQSGASSQSVPEHAHIQNACWSHLQLFRVHVHAPPGTRVSQASPFHGCLLSEPVDTRGAYAQHALVQVGQ